MWLAAAVWDSTVTANWHCPSLLMGKKRCLVWAQKGRRWVQEAHLELSWRHWLVPYLGHCPLGLIPFLTASIGLARLCSFPGGCWGHWWGQGYMVSLKGRLLWIEAQRCWALYLVCIHLYFLCIHLSAHEPFPLLMWFVPLRTERRLHGLCWGWWCVSFQRWDTSRGNASPNPRRQHHS